MKKTILYIACLIVIFGFCSPTFGAGAVVGEGESGVDQTLTFDGDAGDAIFELSTGEALILRLDKHLSISRGTNDGRIYLYQDTEYFGYMEEHGHFELTDNLWVYDHIESGSGGSPTEIMWDNGLSAVKIGTDLPVNGNVYVNYNSVPDDSYLYFNGTSQYLEWMDGSTNFYLTGDYLELAGSLVATYSVSAGTEMYVNWDGPDGDSYVYFYEGTRTGEYFRWDNTDNVFNVSDDFYVDLNYYQDGEEMHLNNDDTAAVNVIIYFHYNEGSETLTFNGSGGGLGVFEFSNELGVNGSVIATTDLNAGLSVKVNYNGVDADSYVYFYEDSSPTGEYIMWDDSEDEFLVSDNLSVNAGTLTSGFDYAFSSTSTGPDGISCYGNAFNFTTGIMDGGTDFQGCLYLNVSNSIHTAGVNDVYGLLIGGITDRAFCTEYGVKVGSGWTYGLYTETAIRSGADLMAEDNIYVNYDGSDTDSYLYFYDASSPTGAYLMWDDSPGVFYFNKDLQTSGNVGIGKVPVSTSEVEILMAAASNYGIKIDGTTNPNTTSYHGLEFLGDTATGNTINSYSAYGLYIGADNSYTANSAFLTQQSRGVSGSGNVSGGIAPSGTQVAQYAYGGSFTSAISGTNAASNISSTFTGSYGYGIYTSADSSFIVNQSGIGQTHRAYTYGIRARGSSNITNTSATLTSNDCYGGYFAATNTTAGTSNSYGVYGTASGGDNNYAGYFSGDVVVAAGDIIVDYGLTVNNNSGAIGDFIAKSDNIADMFWVDSSADIVYINTSGGEMTYTADQLEIYGNLGSTQSLVSVCNTVDASATGGWQGGNGVRINATMGGATYYGGFQEASGAGNPVSGSLIGNQACAFMLDTASSGTMANMIGSQGCLSFTSGTGATATLARCFDAVVWGPEYGTKTALYAYYEDGFTTERASQWYLQGSAHFSDKIKYNSYVGSSTYTRTSYTLPVNITTSDGNATDIWQKTIPTNSVVSVIAHVSGGNASYRATYGKAGLFYRAGAGSAQQGSTQNVFTDIESSAGMDCTISATGNDVQVQVTGAAANTINWTGLIEINIAAW